MEYRILGPVEVLRDGQRVPIGSLKQRALLILLLLSAGRHVSTDRLVEDLWGGNPPPQALTGLRAYVSNLRRALAGGTAKPPIVTRSSGYVLELGEDDRLDAVDFERLTAGVPAALAAGDLDRAEALVADALALWRGAPLADVAYEPFAQGEIARLAELRLAAEEQRVEVWLRAGRHAHAVAEIERLLAGHPHREGLRAALMLALYRSGRQGDALRVYAQGRAALIDDLGVEPGPGLQQLQERILLQDPALDWSPAGEAGGLATPRGTPDPPGNGAWEPATATVLIGRDDEMRRLESALVAAGSGAGRCVLVAGEPGIGKTRLLAETAARARDRGALVAWGHCLSGLGAPPFWPWVEVLRSLVEQLGAERARTLAPRPDDIAVLVPDLGERPEGVDAETARFRLYDAIAGLLRAVARERRFVVLLEDLHWADLASVHLLQFLSSGQGVPGLLVVASYRDVEVADDHPLRDVLAALAREPSAERIQPPGLSAGDVERYITDLTGVAPESDVAATVRDLTSGNPFFVAEVVRLLESGGTVDDIHGIDIPVDVQDVIRRRLDLLPAAAVETLVQGSYGPESFRAPSVASILGRPVEEVLAHCELAVRARLLSEAQPVGAYRFTHALVAELLYRSVPALQRADMHGRIGDLLCGEADGSRPDLALPSLAWHYAQAAGVGRAREAVRWARAAAAHASRQLGFETAAGHLARALSVAEEHLPDDLETRADLARSLAAVRRNMGDLVGAARALREAARLARLLGDAPRLARAALRSGGGGLWGIWSAYGQGNPEVVEWLEEALAGLEPDDPLRASTAGRLAAELFFSDQIERREALAAEAVGLARAGGDAERILNTIAFMRLATWSQENTAERLALADEMVAMSAGTRPLYAAISHHVRMVDRLEGGDVAGSEQDLRAVERLAAQAGQHGLFVQLAWNRAVRAFHEGRFAEAEERAAAALALEARSDPVSARLQHDVMLILVRGEQGRFEEILPMISANVEAEPHASYGWKVSLVRALADLGREHEARDILDGVAGDGFASMPPSLVRPTYVAFLTDACAALGDADRAGQLLALVRPWASRVLVTASGNQAHGALDYYRGLLAATAGDAPSALALHEAGLATNRAAGARPFTARSCLALARCLLRRDAPGDAGRAHGLLAESLGTAEELGMTRLAAEARRGLQEAVPA